MSFPKRIDEFTTAFLSNRYISQLTREENPFTNISMLVFYLVFLINISIFIFLLNQSFQFNQYLQSGFTSFLIILLLVFTFDVLKLFSYWFTATVYRTEVQTSAHVMNFMLNRAGLGLLLLIANLLLAYADISDKLVAMSALVFVLLLFLYRIIKSLPTSLNQGTYPLHYFILYICTLEICPVLVLGKYFSSV